MHLQPVDIATCGNLIFGRWPGPERTESLDRFSWRHPGRFCAGSPLMPARPSMSGAKLRQIGNSAFTSALTTITSSRCMPTPSAPTAYLQKEHTAISAAARTALCSSEPTAAKRLLRRCGIAAGTRPINPKANRVFHIFPNLTDCKFASIGAGTSRLRNIARRMHVAAACAAGCSRPVWRHENPFKCSPTMFWICREADPSGRHAKDFARGQCRGGTSSRRCAAGEWTAFCWARRNGVLPGSTTSIGMRWGSQTP